MTPGLRGELSTTELFDLQIPLFTNQSIVCNCQKMTDCEQFQTKYCLKNSRNVNIRYRRLSCSIEIGQNVTLGETLEEKLRPFKDFLSAFSELFVSFPRFLRPFGIFEIFLRDFGDPFEISETFPLFLRLSEIFETFQAFLRPFFIYFGDLFGGFRRPKYV